MDESKGILLPMHGILLFSKENEHPRMDFGAQMSGFGPQMGIACAFKSDLKGKVDESKGTLLPVRGLLLFFQAK